MKRLLFSVSAAAAIFLASCGGDTGSKPRLTDAEDSLQYATSVYVSRRLPQFVYNRLAVSPENLDDFLRGVRDAFPLSDSPEALAYAYGLYVGSSAVDMLADADKLIYSDDTLKHISPQLFLQAMVAVMDTSVAAMPLSAAVDYYNSHKYRSAGDKFMKMNATRPGVESLPSGLQYKIETLGSGPVAESGDTVRCIYRGYFTNGDTFDSSRGAAVKQPVDNAVAGLSEAFRLLPVGTTAKIYVPWELGYGSAGSGSVPPYSVLVFDVEISELIKN